MNKDYHYSIIIYIYENFSNAVEALLYVSYMQVHICKPKNQIMKGVFIMLMRNFAGGVVFSGDKVLLLKNEKDEWVLPRKIMRDGELSSEVAVKKIREESGVLAEIVFTAGQTNYEFSSITRKKPFCDKTTWYIMESLDEENKMGNKPRFMDFVKVDEAMNLIDSSYDRSLVSLSFRKYRELVRDKEYAFN